MAEQLTRRDALASLCALAATAATPRLVGQEARSRWRLSVFKADVTPRLGHPLIGNHFAPSKSVADPLFAKGFVLQGPDKPIVLVAVDWCEIRNEAYANWRKALA